jgi:hypothetical protein
VERGFTDRAAAERFRDERERAARVSWRDFWVFYTCPEIPGLYGLSSFDWPVLFNWLLDAGILPPPDEDPKASQAWRDWWNGCARSLTELQRARLFEGLDRFHFYDIIEVACVDAAAPEDFPPDRSADRVEGPPPWPSGEELTPGPEAPPLPEEPPGPPTATEDDIPD